MKRFVIGILFLITSSSAFAQRPNLQIRIHGGLNAYSIKFKQAELPGGLSIGYLGGFGLRVSRKNFVGQLDVNFIRSGIKVDLSGINPNIDRSTIRTNAFEFPLMAGYRVVDNAYFKLQLMGGISTLFFASIVENDLNLEVSQFKQPQFGLRFSPSIDFTFFSIDFSYTYGLNKLFKDLSRSNAHLFQLNVGVVF